MTVLIRNLSYIFRFRESGCLQVGQGLRYIIGQSEIIKSDIPTRFLGDADGILFFQQSFQRIIPHIFVGLRITIECYISGDMTNRCPVHLYSCFKAGIGSQGHRQPSGRSIGSQAIVLRGPDGEERFVKEMPSAMIPGIVINLVERMIIIVRWITSGSKRLVIYRLGIIVILCQEIIAIVGIRVTGTDECILGGPCHRANSIEEPFVANHACRHLF